MEKEEKRYSKLAIISFILPLIPILRYIAIELSWQILASGPESFNKNYPLVSNISNILSPPSSIFYALGIIIGGFVTSIISLRIIDKNNLKGKGLAIVSLLLSSIYLLIIILVVIFALGASLSSNYHHIDSSLLPKYPALSYAEMRQVRVSGLPTIVSHGKTIYSNKTREFSCNGKIINPIVYLSNLTGFLEDAIWSEFFVIDCDDYYWVVQRGSSTETAFYLYGPFFFNETADFLKERYQGYNDCLLNSKNENIIKYHDLVMNTDLDISENENATLAYSIIMNCESKTY